MVLLTVCLAAPAVCEGAEVVDTSAIVVTEGVGFDGIAVGNRRCTKEFIKKKLGPPQEEQENWLNYRGTSGLDFAMASDMDMLVEIRLNEGFAGKLTSGVSMSSSMDDVFKAYGKPFAQEEVKRLLPHFGNRILYTMGNFSKISYIDKGLLFWFDRGQITQIVITRRRPSARTVEQQAAGVSFEPMTRQEALEELEKLGIPFTSEEFLKTLDRRDTTAAHLFIIAGINPNARDEDEQTALMLASRRGQTDIVKVLLEKGADVSPRETKFGWTAFLLAANGGHTEVARMLLDRGVDVNMKTNEGMTGLIGAASYGHTETVELLLDRGADVNARNRYGLTPLMSAAEGGHSEIVRMLLDKGADVHTTSSGGATAFSLAASKGSTDILRMLLEEGANINEASDDGDTALMAAAAGGRTDAVKFLLQRGADVNARENTYGWTPLMRSIMSGRASTVDALIDAGANTNTALADGTTALMLAAWSANVDIVKTLLNRGADPNAKDQNGRTALDRAKELDHTDIIQLLVARGAKE